LVLGFWTVLQVQIQYLLDAIEEVQVNLAPFDVRFSWLLRASVMLLQVGTIDFKGSVYYYLSK